MKRNIIIIIIFIVCVALVLILIKRDFTQGPLDISTKNIENQNIEELKPQDQEKDLIILKIAHEFPIWHPQHIAVKEKFASLVEKRSGWKIRVEVYPENKLGTEQVYYQGVRSGTVEMCIAWDSISKTIPRLKELESPFLFKDYEAAIKTLSKKIDGDTQKKLEKFNLHGLYFSINGFNQINTFKAIDKKGDMEIATDFSKESVNILKDMGFKVMSTNEHELPLVLQQKVVDGHDFPIIWSYKNGCNDNIKNIVITNHMINPSIYLVNREFWNSLEEKYKKVIEEAALEACLYEIQLLEEKELEIIKLLKEKGVKVQYGY